MSLKLLRIAACATLAAGLAACGGGSSDPGTGASSSSGGGSSVQTGQMAMIVSDASSDDWATVGVEILSISLTPQGGGSPVTVYTAPATPPMVNLEELDQIGEVLGNVPVPVGTYTSATVTVAANPGDVQLVVSAQPEAGFAGTAGEAIPSADIQIAGAQGASGDLTVPVGVDFQSPLVVTASGNAIEGYKWWNFAYPTLLNDGSDAISQFSAAVGGGGSGGFTFAGTNLYAWGISDARWADPANPTGWALSLTILVPSPLPRGTVVTGLANGAFTMTLAGGTAPGTVAVGAASGSATLVYQVDRSNGTVSVSPVDITTASGLSTLTRALAAGTAVKVYGVPQSDGTLQAYVLMYFTGTEPAE